MSSPAEIPSDVEHTCDVAVIGAGPAGAAAAWACARDGLRVCIVDKARFPREKVCGGCVSPMGMVALRTIGLESAVRRKGVSVRAFELHAGKRRARLALDGSGVAIARAELDELVLTHARAAGASLLIGNAKIEHHDAGGARVRVVDERGTQIVSARLAIVADGLAGTSLPATELWAPRIAKASFFGVGASLPASCAAALCENQTIAMRCGSHGYFGAVRLADGTVDVAAAMSPERTKQLGGPAEAVAELADSCGLDRAFAYAAAWKGTPLLTRSRNAEAPGVFVVGDSANYVEPFTGEGISWGLASGIAVATQVNQTLAGRYRPGDWTAALRAIVSRRRLSCRLTALALRRPVLLHPAISLLSWTPRASKVVATLVAGPWKLAVGT